ncbi:MAG: YqaJ viral recombinase family protein [Methanothrix sp.]|nr:YqaJ viral recombinase family protein [Candidatus Micrarchaeota archaeon]MDD3523907.1 YqaJ viral recombinase family protein [Candidatus Cloacimonadota bacterium]MDD5769256.1 YqaJ viral recombinase family protein [Methanothrix sp.]
MKVIARTADLDRSSWLELRRKGIGGSDAPAVAGVSKWKSSLEVYLEKIGQIDKRDETESIYWGERLEEIVAEEFQLRSGKKVRRKRCVCQSSKNPFMIANIDREVVAERAGLECKTTSVFNANNWDLDHVPDDYMLQCQHYMEVMDWDYIYLAVLIGGQKFRWMRVEKDPDLIGQLVSIERDFWRRVESKDPPPVDGSKAATDILNFLYGDTGEGVIDLPEESHGWVLDYFEFSQEEKMAKEQKDEASNRLKNLLKDNREGRIKNFKVIWQPVTTQRLNTSRIKSELPDLYEKYLEESTYRKFSIKKEESLI